MSNLSSIKESKSAATIRRKRPQNAFFSKSKSQDDTFDPLLEDPEFNDGDSFDGPPMLKLILSSDWILFLSLVAFRALNALMIQTSYVPDEYWQSVEVAHNMAFGYGYLTWEWRVGIRGYSYPFIFASVYKVLEILHLDNRLLLIKLPRIIQGVFAAVGDLYLYKLSRRLSGTATARIALLLQLTSWFTFYCCTRTLTNSMETVLTIVAMYYFPWPDRPRLAQYKYLVFVGIAIVMRPTAAILWLPMCSWHVWMYRHISWRVIKLFAEIGLAILSFSSIIDRIFYQEWVYVQYNFFQFNVLSNMGAFYGSHPWHWYITQGFVVIMGFQIFPFMMAARKGVQPAMLGVVTWTITVYSILEHKEFRFLMPIIPLCMHIAAVYLTPLCEDHVKDDNNDDNFAQDKPKENQKSSKQGFKRKKCLIILLLITNLPVAIYTSLIHQRGTVDVMKFLEVQADSAKEEPMDVFFLMPCHSTPFHSYLHRNVSLQFLTCEPNLDKIPNYIDEADVFYNDPNKWLYDKYDHQHSSAFPSHIVLFNSLQPVISATMERMGYHQCAKMFHTHVPSGRVGSHVIVLCKSDWAFPNHRNNLKEKLSVTLGKKRESLKM